MLLLERLTCAPPLGAALVSVTVPVELCPPVTVDGLTLTPCNAAGAVELLIVKVAVSTSLPPADLVTACVIVWLPLATCAVFHGSPAEVGELLTLSTKSYGS